MVSLNSLGCLGWERTYGELKEKKYFLIFLLILVGKEHMSSLKLKISQNPEDTFLGWERTYELFKDELNLLLLWVKVGKEHMSS